MAIWAKRTMILGALLGMASGGQAQPGQGSGNAGERIATQPARDVGLQRTRVPAVLLIARDNPYSLAGLRACPQLARAVQSLDDVLGPDYDAPQPRVDRDAALAEAGGAAVVNSFIPFRGVVRELSGAAESDRQLQAAIYAGLARRGFLRGVQNARGCRR